MTPGFTAFTLTPFGASSRAAVLIFEQLYNFGSQIMWEIQIYMLCVLPGQHVDGGLAHVVSHHARESSEAYARKKSFKLQKSINFDKNAQKNHSDFFVSFLYLKISILSFYKDSLLQSNGRQTKRKNFFDGMDTQGTLTSRHMFSLSPLDCGLSHSVRKKTTAQNTIIFHVPKTEK